jgi:hypothetical protein
MVDNRGERELRQSGTTRESQRRRSHRVLGPELRFWSDRLKPDLRVRRDRPKQWRTCPSLSGQNPETSLRRGFFLGDRKYFAFTLFLSRTDVNPVVDQRLVDRRENLSISIHHETMEQHDQRKALVITELRVEGCLPESDVEVLWLNWKLADVLTNHITQP